MNRMGDEGLGLQLIEDYLPFLEQIGKVYGGMAGAADADAVEKVVQAIYEAATDGTDRLRYYPTTDIKPILEARRNTSEVEYQRLQTIFSYPNKQSMIL
ncbi:hypothetical protein KBP46_00055 [Chryseobacterium sp. PCH239]|uniref:hypothetical protein n=1 Tax=Chryseobacterium sp. PCH239 TaxID=2825845 RepID=UPI001C105FDA|nr:hypothetical protein [Chryseobacterium sp. PCH239]QWT86320.1 hypothetical protein KBP46_00055 [Chryseobacterium sp. PCH239]